MALFLESVATPSGYLPRPGEMLGRYEILHEIGIGGMAVVYAARLRSMGVDKIFAIKVLLPHVREEAFVHAFLDEARIAAQIEHPNVVQLFELGEHEGCPYMVQQLLRGQSLSQTSKRSKEIERPFSTPMFLWIAAEAAEGLHAAHEARGSDGQPLAVVHRDVSPQNIHVGYDGRVRVVDFGIARARGRATQTDSGLIKGKLRYMSPEQIARGRDVDRRADLWALGVMLWEQLASRPLFREDDEQTTLWNIANKRVPRLSEIDREIAPAFDDLVASCLEREPARRPKSAAEVASVLRASCGGASRETIAAEMSALFAHEQELARERLSSEPRRLVAKPARRRTWPLIAIGATATLMIAIGVAWSTRVGSDPAPQPAPRVVQITKVATPERVEAPIVVVDAGTEAPTRVVRRRPRPVRQEPTEEPSRPLLPSPYAH